jgi:hypothetical protein
VSSPTRFAEMTGAELRDKIYNAPSNIYEVNLAALRDAILAERDAEHAVRMRETRDRLIADITELRTRAERAERELAGARSGGEQFESAWKGVCDALDVAVGVGAWLRFGTTPAEDAADTIKALGKKLRTAERERDDAKADFLHAHNARVTAEAALGEAKREGAREALTAYADKAHIWNDQRIALGVESFRDAEYPATPSGEVVKSEVKRELWPSVKGWPYSCDKCGEQGECFTGCGMGECDAVRATPQPEAKREQEIRVYVDPAIVPFITITPDIARRLLALAQTGGAS